MLRIMAMHVTLFLYVFGFFITNSGGFFWDEPQPVLVPADRLVFVGETLRMKCTLLDPADVKSARFKITNQNGESWWLPDEDHVVEDLSVLINISVTQNFTESTTVECRNESESFTSTFIFAENPIQAIQNFSAVYLYNDRISLTWSWAIQNKTDVDISVKWSASNTFKENYTFSCDSITKESCVIPNKNYFGELYIYVNITLSALRWDKRPDSEYLTRVFNTSVTSLHSVYIFNNTKSGPPEELKVVSTNSSCFKLSWKNPAYLMNCPICSRFYAIQVQKVNEALDAPGEEFYQNVGQPFQDPILTVCGLEAYTKYQVTFRVKREEVNPWSDFSTTGFRTVEDRPLEGPPVLSTNYYLKECVSNKRQFYIYWQEPPKATVRGELKHYKIIFNNQTYSIRKDSNYFVNEIECLSELEVSIYTVNSLGESLEPSTIVVPGSQRDFSEALQFKVEEHYNSTISTTLKNMTITWDSSHWKDDNATLMLYRCEENYIQNTCFTDYTVEEFRLTQQSLSVNNVNLKENLFGFALKLGNGEKQGIVWTECVFRKELEPEKPVGLQVTPGSEDNSLFISWLATPCSRKNKVLIQYYVVYICPSPDSMDGCSSHKVYSTTQNFTARSLPSNENVYVSIRAVSPYLEGKLSDPKLASIKPNIKDSSLAVIILGICLSLGLILLIIGLVWLILSCRESKRRIKGLIDNMDTVSCDGSNSTTDTVITKDNQPYEYDKPNSDHDPTTDSEISQTIYTRMSSGSESTSEDTSEYHKLGCQSSGAQTDVISCSGSSNLHNNAGNESLSIERETSRGPLIGDKIETFTRKIVLEDIQVNVSCDDPNTTTDTVITIEEQPIAYDKRPIVHDKQPIVYDQPNAGYVPSTSSDISYSRTSSGSENTSQCSDYQRFGYQSSGTQTEVISRNGSSNLQNNAGNESLCVDFSPSRAYPICHQRETSGGLLIGDQIEPFTSVWVEPDNRTIQVMCVAQETRVDNQQIETHDEDNQSTEGNQSSNKDIQSSNEDIQNNWEYLSNEQTSQPFNTIIDYVKEFS